MDLNKLNFLNFEIHNKKTLPYLLTAMGCMYFLIITILAMFFYPGGYNFFTNFFSHLGLTQVNGMPNPVSFLMFTSAVVIAGSLLVPFFITIPKHVADNKFKKVLAWATTSFGVIVAIAYIGIGLAPTDINGPAHGWCVLIAFTGTFPVILVYAILIFLKKGIPKYVPYTFMFFTVMIFAYILLMFFGPSRETLEGLVINVVGQKIIIYTEMISMVIAGYGMAQYADR